MDLLTIVLAAALGAVVMGLLTRRKDADAVGECGSAPSGDSCGACNIDCERSESPDVES